MPEIPDAERLGLRARREILGVGGWHAGLSERDAAALFEEGRELADALCDRKALAKLLEAYGAVRGFAGDLPGMLEHIHEASRIAETTGDPFLTANLQNRLVFAHVHLGNLREALTLAESALAEIPSGAEDQFAIFEVGPSAIKGMLLAGMARIDDGRKYLARAAELAEMLPDHLPTKPIVHLFSTTVAWYRGDGKTADLHADALTRYAERTKSAWGEVLAGFCRGQADLLNGRPAMAPIEEGLRIAREHRVGLEGEADLLALLAEAHLDAGDEWRGLAFASEAVRVADARGTAWWGIRALRVEARALIAKDGAAREEEIRATLARAQASIDRTGALMEEPFVHEQLAALASVLGDAQAAEAERREAARGFANAGAPVRAAALERR